MFALVEIVDVGPVGHHHAVPAESFLQPLCYQLATGVYRLSVDGTRVDHDGQCPGFHQCLERGEAFLAQLAFGHVGRCAVFPRAGRTVAEIVLHAGCHMILVDVVGVVALKATDGSTAHDGIHQRVFAIVLPDAWPARVAAQVNSG